MASGQQKAKQNLDEFNIWKSTQTHDDFRQISRGGQLNRSEIAKAVGCGKSALNQNPALRAALQELEDNLRNEGVLPPLTDSAKESMNTEIVANKLMKPDSMWVLLNMISGCP